MAQLPPSIRDLKQAVEGIVQLSSTSTGSATLSNGQNATFTMTITPNSGKRLITAPDITLYLTSVLVANAFPDGSNIDMSQWQIVGPYNDWGATDNINSKTKLYIRNISAGASQTILFRGQGRVIINSITPTST